MAIKREGADGGSLDPTKIRGEGCRGFGAWAIQKFYRCARRASWGVSSMVTSVRHGRGQPCSVGSFEEGKRARKPRPVQTRVEIERDRRGGEEGGWRRERARELGRAGNETNYLGQNWDVARRMLLFSASSRDCSNAERPIDGERPALAQSWGRASGP